MHDVLNAFMLLSNFLIVPATAYGSQLALGYYTCSSQNSHF